MDLIRTYLIRGPVSNPLPPRFARDRLGEWRVTLAVQLALSVQIHDVDLNQAIWCPSPDAKIKPGSAKDKAIVVLIVTHVAFVAFLLCSFITENLPSHKSF